MIHYLLREQTIPAPIRQVWEFFADPRNLNDITPPDLNFEIISGAESRMTAGQLIEYRVEFLPGLRSQWLTEIAHVREKEYFVDEQRVGPYQFWYHEHKFDRVKNGVQMTDRISYAVPFGILGELLHKLWIQSRLAGIFDYRREKIAALFGEY